MIAGSPSSAPWAAPLTVRHLTRAGGESNAGVTALSARASLPNWQFAVWLLASAVMWLGHPWGWVRAVLVVLASAALALWAGDEVLRGVNPFRRLLGFAVLSWLVFSLVRLG